MKSQLLEFLGGELLQSKSPLVYDALSNVQPCGSEMLNASSTPGILDRYLSVEEIFANSQGIGVLHRHAFHKPVSFIAVVSKLYDEETGNLIDTFTEYWENSTCNEKKHYCNTPLAEQSAKHNIYLVSTYTWSEDGQNVLEYTEKRSVIRFAGEQEIISSLTVTAPRAKDKSLTVVLYDREAAQGETIDYQYTQVLSPDQKSAKVMMPFAGSVEVSGNYKITGIHTAVEKPQLHLILENGAIINYNYDEDTFAEQFVISSDGKKMSWNFKDNWNTALDLHNFVIKTIVNFSCQFSLEVEEEGRPGVLLHPIVTITSAKSPEERTAGALEIEPIGIRWGCVAKGTQVTMADGSQTKIEDIRCGDRIMGEGMVMLFVQDVLTGYEHELVRLETANGCKLSLTGNHPVKTTRGLVIAGELTAADVICTKDGESRVSSIYCSEYYDSVYNLIVEPTSAFFCNGIVVGDFEMQNSMGFRMCDEAMRTELQIELENLM